MTNERLLYEALEKAIQYCEAHNIAQDTPSLAKRIELWYNHTDIVDPEMLAALALESDTFEYLPMTIIENITYYYFPKYSVAEEDERW